jgi:hypothetical protein
MRSQRSYHRVNGAGVERAMPQRLRTVCHVAQDGSAKHASCDTSTLVTKRGNKSLHAAGIHSSGNGALRQGHPLEASTH